MIKCGTLVIFNIWVSPKAVYTDYKMSVFASSYIPEENITQLRTNTVRLCPHTERCLEDHELVVQVQASMSSDSKFLFRKNYAKYEFFRNPLVIAYIFYFFLDIS